MRLSVAACTHPQRVHKDAHSLTGWILAEVKTEIAYNLVTPDIFCFILLPGSLTHFIPFLFCSFQPVLKTSKSIESQNFSEP